MRRNIPAVSQGKDNHQLLNYGILMLCIFLWSTVPLSMKTALDSFGPITFAWLRGATGFLLILPIALKRGFEFRKMLTKRSLFYGLIAFVLNTMLIQVGMQWCSANVASILMATMPVFMLAGGAVFLSERLNFWKTSGAVLATLGIVMTCLGGALVDENTTLIGILIVATAPLTWTVYTIFQKKRDPDTDSIVVSAYILGCGSLISLPLMLGEISLTGFPNASPSAWLLAVYAGAICLGIGNTAWAYSASKIDASIVGLIYNTCPVLGFIWPVFFGEAISALQIVGCLVVILGVLVGVKDQWIGRNGKPKNIENPENSPEKCT